MKNEKKKRKEKTIKQYFIQNFQSKNKRSKFITKVMSKFELWKEQTGKRLGTSLNNKKYQWFLFKTLKENWKTHFIGTFTFIVD